nr:hypothetical protein [Tanacetum cinerariifolium]
MCEIFCQSVQKKQKEKRIEEEQAVKAQSWKFPVCYDDDDDEEGYNSLNDNIISELPSYSAVTPTEPINSLKGENGCDVLTGFTTFSNALFDVDYDSDSSDDQSLFVEDVREKIYSNPLFDEEIIPMEIDQHSFNAESDLIGSMPNHDSSITIYSKIDSLFDEFAGELTLLKSFSPGINKTDCHPEKEIRLTKRFLYYNSSPRPPEEIKIDLFLNLDDPMPPGIEEDDDDFERDIPIFEELLDNYSLSLPATESYHFDIPSPYRPPAKPPDGNIRTLNIKMLGDVSDQKEDIRLIERLLYDNSSLRPPEEFVSENSNTEIEYFSPSPIPVEDSDSFMEEIDLTITPDDPMPPGIEDDDYDYERDTLILKDLPSNDTLSLPVIESYHFDIPSFSRPPAKPDEQMTQLTSMCEMLCQIVQKKREEKRIEEEQAAKAQNWKLPVCFDDDDDEERSNSLQDNIISRLPPCSAITPNEPVDSLNMGDEHLNTILATESDEFIKSCVENLVPNPSESEGENGCDVLACFTTFSNVLFEADYESDSSDYHSCSNEDFLKEIFSNPLFEEEINSMKIDQHHFNAESDLVESLLNRDPSIISFSSKIDSLLDEFVGELTLLKSISSGIDETNCYSEEDIHLIKRLLYDNSSPHPSKEFLSENSNADIESFSPSPIPIEDSDSFMKEIDLSSNPDDPMLPGIEEDDDDSKRDMLIHEELPSNYSLFSPYGNTGILNIKMMGDNSEQKVPIANLTITRVSNKEKSPDLLSHRGLEIFKFSAKCPMRIHGKNIPTLDVPLFHFYPLDQLKYGGIRLMPKDFILKVFISSASIGNKVVEVMGSSGSGGEGLGNRKRGVVERWRETGR